MKHVKLFEQFVNEAKLQRGDKITIEFDDEDGDYKAGDYTIIGGKKGGKELEGMGIKIFMTDKVLNSIEYTVNEGVEEKLEGYDEETAEHPPEPIEETVFKKGDKIRVKASAMSKFKTDRQGFNNISNPIFTVVSGPKRGYISARRAGKLDDLPVDDVELLSVNEGSYEDFITDYGREIKSLSKKIQSIGKKFDSGKISEEGMEKAFKTIENRYDREAVSVIDGLMNDNGRTDLREIAQIAVQMQNRTGTEMQQIVNAMEDFVYSRELNK